MENSTSQTPHAADGGSLRGRFSEATDEFVQVFTASIDFDQRLFREDIAGSIAHATMLETINVLTKAELDQIVAGLQTIQAEIEGGRLQWRVDLEDVHMNIEHRLIELIGDTGKKLHTGRSRNDQVATDIRLHLRSSIDGLVEQQGQLMTALADLAESNADTIMPGFTHLQAAQPITFGHHLMAWFEMLRRDRDRLLDCRKRLNQLPLGAAALAGSPYKPNRALVAELLGFDGVCENSLDAVSDRDFAIEFCAATALSLTHMSRWCEEMVLWSSQQFNFITLPDRFCTGSSIMPQKKNPDVPELIRGKTGRVNGHLIALLTLMKSQPLAYNKDNQEDKEPLFDAIDTLANCLTALIGMVPNIQANKDVMLDATLIGFTTATDLADYLVRKNVPFRDAHELVGQAVQLAVSLGKGLEELSVEELNGPGQSVIESDIYDVLTLQGSIASRDHLGGTAPSQVRKAIARARATI
ncbi:MAG: argininosuccinate lyase [Gammaproteobacteria bacterium TMED243]|nr:argininosuccinate lyase [Gammaproteobacteria bacterium]RPG31264.1 MAG: argininosuccinate lyase [Gammaproteobacteria bacterium TMED243]